jgi:hypothetical protein
MMRSEVKSLLGHCIDLVQTKVDEDINRVSEENLLSINEDSAEISISIDAKSCLLDESMTMTTACDVTMNDTSYDENADEENTDHIRKQLFDTDVRRSGHHGKSLDALARLKVRSD